MAPLQLDIWIYSLLFKTTVLIQAYMQVLNAFKLALMCMASYAVLSNMLSPFVSEQSISHAYEEISSCKTELQQAKRIRRNRQGITNKVAKLGEKNDTKTL